MELRGNLRSAQLADNFEVKEGRHSGRGASRDPESSLTLNFEDKTGFRVLRYAQPRNDGPMGSALRAAPE